MADEDLRKLHAKWKSTGTPVDGAAYLRALVRSGSMTEAQLQVAALCDHAGARHAAGRAAVPTNPVELVLALKEFGPHVYVRAAIAALESARAVAGEHGRDRLEVVPLLKHWLKKPDDELAEKIKAVGYSGGPEPVGGAVGAARWAVEKHKLHELDKRDSYVDPATLVDQERIVLMAIRNACLSWVFDAPW